MGIIALFFQFAKFGLLCFGGGYMLIPLLISEFVGGGKLLSAEQFANLVSVSQVTPGPVGINTATYVGFISHGFFGALAATAGLVFPTLILAGLAISLIRRCKEHPLMRGVLYGARLAALALIGYACIIFLGLSVFTGGIPWQGFWKFLQGHREILPDWNISVSGLLIAVFATFIIIRTRIKTTWVIMISAVLGALLFPWLG